VGIWILEKSGIWLVDLIKNRASDYQTIQKPDAFVELVQFN
jgi:hypothetical protein